MNWTEAKKTLQLALPIILGELSQMILHLIDSAMVGTVGYKHLAAAGLVFSVINIPFVLAIGLTFSISQMVSLASGKNDKQLVSHYFYNGIIQCAIAGLVISCLLFFSVDILDHLKQDPAVVALAKPFMQLISLSVFPMIIFMAFKQFADGLEHTKTAMFISFLALPINIFLNYLLIYGNWGFPRMELLGAGYATLITRCLVALILGIFILNSYKFHRFVAVKKRQWTLRRDTQKALLKIGVPSSLQITMEAGAFAISGILIGMISAKDQAAHQIALSIASFTFMVSLGLAQAGSIRTSNAFGQQNADKIRDIGVSNMVSSVIYGICCLTMFVLLRYWLPTFFSKEPEVITIAAGLLLWAAVFQISDSLQAISAGLLRGVKDVKVPTVIVAVAYWVIGIPVGYYLAFHGGMKASGIWIGFILGLTVSAILLTMRFMFFTKHYKENNKYARV